MIDWILSIWDACPTFLKWKVGVIFGVGMVVAFVRGFRGDRPRLW